MRELLLITSCKSWYRCQLWSLEWILAEVGTIRSPDVACLTAQCQMDHQWSTPSWSLGTLALSDCNRSEGCSNDKRLPRFFSLLLSIFCFSMFCCFTKHVKKLLEETSVAWLWCLLNQNLHMFSLPLYPHIPCYNNKTNQVGVKAYCVNVL